MPSSLTGSTPFMTRQPNVISPSILLFWKHIKCFSGAVSWLLKQNGEEVLTMCNRRYTTNETLGRCFELIVINRCLKVSTGE